MKINITNITQNGKTLDVTFIKEIAEKENAKSKVLPEINVLSIEWNPLSTIEETQHAIRNAITKSITEKHNRDRRSKDIVQLLNLVGEFSLDIPEPAILDIHDGRLEGSIGLYTKNLHIVVTDGIHKKDMYITPNKNGRFSAYIENLTVVSVTPISECGLCGEAQI